MNRAVFLDRDGVINRKAPEGRYITSWKELELLSGVVEGIGLLNRAGLKVILVTNQRCVARGMMTIEELEALHHRLQEELTRASARIDAIYYCPHDFDDACACRKPKPGMILQAAKDNRIVLASSWVVGDSESDIEAGELAGCMTARISENSDVRTNAQLVAGSLLDVARKITS